MKKKRRFLGSLKTEMRIEAPFAIKRAGSLLHLKGENDRVSVEDSRKCLRMPTTTVASMTSRGFYITTEVSVRDISVYGIGGYAVCPYLKGETVKVRLKLNKSDKEIIQGTVMGEIRWSSKVDKGERYAFGLEFFENELERKQPELFAYIRELEEAFHPTYSEHP
ncbi:PilZ domain-containing protein [Nitrospira defluvii]|nr:PilZ domain-containing protein [Nitrospira defluvii]